MITALRRRLVKAMKYTRLWILGGGTVGIVGLLLFLQLQGIYSTLPEPVACGGTINCETNFSINVPTRVLNYLGEQVDIKELCFNENLHVSIVGNVQNVQVFRADNRYRDDNPDRWKPFSFTDNCIPLGWNHFKINGTKPANELVTWSINPRGDWLPLNAANPRTCYYEQSVLYDVEVKDQCLKTEVLRNGTNCVEWSTKRNVTYQTTCVPDGVLRIDNQNVSRGEYAAVYAHPKDADGVIRIDYVEEGGGFSGNPSDFKGCRDAGGWNCKVVFYNSTQKITERKYNSVLLPLRWSEAVRESTTGRIGSIPLKRPQRKLTEADTIPFVNTTEILRANR